MNMTVGRTFMSAVPNIKFRETGEKTIAAFVPESNTCPAGINVSPFVPESNTCTADMNVRPTENT